MKVSVVIPVFNEEAVIRNCLLSLCEQDIDEIEVIIVDDGSQDGTMEEVSKVGKCGYSLRVIKQKHMGTAVARNRGAKHSLGEILVFVDADMTFEPDFLRKLIFPIKARKARGTFSKEEYVSNWDNVWARAWNINQNWPARRRHPKSYPSRQKVFRAILKSEFERVGGFDKGGYTDDYTLSEKLNYLAENAQGAKFYHRNPESLKEVLFQAKWSGKREYKFGIVGAIWGLMRASLLFSLVTGLYKGWKSGMLRFVVFRIIYDFGISIGIIEYGLLGKGYK